MFEVQAKAGPIKQKASAMCFFLLQYVRSIHPISI